MKQIEFQKAFALLDCLPNGVFLINHEYRVVYWNSIMASWTKKNATEMIGSFLFETYPHLKSEKYKSRLDQLFNRGPPAIFSAQFHKYLIPVEKSNNTLQIQQAIVTPLRGIFPNQELAMFVIDDLSDLYERIDKNKDLKNKALEDLKSIKKLESKMEEHIQAMESALDGIAILNEDFEIINCNKSFAEIFKYPTTTAIMQENFLVRLASIEEERESIYEAIQNEKQYKGILTGLDHAGKAFPMEISIRQLQTGNYICVLRDITERIMQENKLKESIEIANEANQRKSEFLAKMSHELRTPLNGILILSKLLSDNVNANLNEKEVEFSKTIHHSGTKLLENINDILDVANIESNQVKVVFLPVRLKKIFARISDEYASEIKSKQLSFETKFNEDIPDFIHSNEDKINQIIKNFLNNAIKFTTNGSISFLMTLNEQEIHIIIADSGCGMEEEKLNDVFLPFYQVESKNDVLKGTGLGLSIVKGLTDLIKGKITITSKVGEGTTVTLQLPIKQET